MTGAGMPVRSATRSGGKPATASRNCCRPSAEGSGRSRFSSKMTWIIARSRSASVPGRMGKCWSAMAAVSVRRGSTTTSRPPRRRSSSSRREIPPAVIKLPLEASGFAPSMRKKPVRSTSGTGSISWCPNISSAASICGSWSTEVAEKRARDPRAREKSGIPSNAA